MSSLQRASARLKISPGPKVSFASASRWGTEPEGWHVDLPYAVWVGVNYSPKVNSSYQPGGILSTEIHHTPLGVTELTDREWDNINHLVYYYIPLGMMVPVRYGTHDQREDQAPKQGATRSRPGGSA
jgi:hypothetical protein